MKITYQDKDQDGDTIVIDRPPEVKPAPDKVYGDLMKKLVTVDKKEPELPKMHDVFLVNDRDDAQGTPAEVVVDVVEKVFHLNRNAAFKSMMEAHTNGKAFLVKMTKEVAEQSCQKVRIEAAAYPLTCVHAPE